MLLKLFNTVCEMSQTRAQTLKIVRALSNGDYKLQHDEKKKIVFIQLDPETVAWVDYKRLGDKEVLLYHTDVPKKYAGKGIGRILAEQTFKFFDDRKDKMKITCTFLQKIQNQEEK